MPRGPTRRPRQDDPPPGPPTLSLPVIPRTASPRASVPPTGDRNSQPMRAARHDTTGQGADPWDVFPASPTRVSRPYRTVADPDAWDDQAEAQFSRRQGSDSVSPPEANVPGTRELLALSRSLPSLRHSGSQRAVGAILPRAVKLQPPPRPIKRTMIWQGILLAIALATIFAGIRSAGTENTAYASPFEMNASSHTFSRIVDQVPILTQIDPTIGYDSPDQYKRYSGAACSAAAMSSVLLAWGDPQGHIGKIIDDMGNYLSPTGGLQSPQGFAQVANKHGYNVWMSFDVTAAQIAQIVNTQGIPVIIGVRYRPGSGLFSNYYRYFAPGHFLVVTGADANGFQIVDNSTYYVHYLSTADFMALWDRPHAVVFTPQNYQWQPPGKNEWP